MRVPRTIVRRRLPLLWRHRRWWRRRCWLIRCRGRASECRRGPGCAVRADHPCGAGVNGVRAGTVGEAGMGRRLGRVRLRAQPQPLSGFGGEPASVSENEATLTVSGLVAVVPSS
jgi:hypothetical protein